MLPKTILMSRHLRREQVRRRRRNFIPLQLGCHKPGKPGILRDFSEHGNVRDSQGILCNLRENCNKQSMFSSSFKYLCKTAGDWVNMVCVMEAFIRFILKCNLSALSVSSEIFSRDARNPKRGFAIVSRPSVRLSVCNVEVPWAYRLD